MIEPTSVDVNVHPTKREVRFLKQDEIIEQISLKVNEELSKVDTTRTFKASSILTGSQSIGQTSAVIRSKSLYRQSNSQVNADSSNLSQTTPNKVRKYENKMVRTDASQAKITSFLKSSQYVEGNSLNKDNNNEVLNLEEDTEEEQNNNISSPSPTVDDTSNKLIELPNEETNILDKSSQVKQTGHNFNYVVIKNKRSMVNLSSIKELREAEDNRAHKELTNIFANLNYVGIVDTERRLISIQHDLKLFLVDYGSICNELFYQIGLTDFSNFGRISLLTENNENLKLVNLLSVFEDLPKQKVRDIVSSLWQMKEMLDEYFSITLKTDDDSENLNQVQLQSIPLLLKGYNPSLDKLPLFIRRLGTKVNWENEIDCLNAILKEIALLYVPPIIKTIDQNDGNLCDEQKIAFVNKSELLETTLENIVFPTIKRRFLATNNLVKDVVEIANLPGLYKVFERC